MKEKKAAKTTRLDLTGSLTVRNAGILRENLMTALDGGSNIELNVEEVKEIDLSSLQLLCSAHRYAVNKGKSLILNDPEGLLSETGRKAGFSLGNKCRFNRKNDCIWMEG